MTSTPPGSSPTTSSKLGDWDAALAPLPAAGASQAEKREEIWYLLGTVHMELSKRALAQGADEYAESALVHQVSGEVMESMKNYDGALIRSTKRWSRWPRIGLAPTTSSGTCIGRPLNGRRQRAEFEAELSLDPNHCPSQWKPDNILLEQNLNPEQALADIDKALAICPGLTQARLDHRPAYLKAGTTPKSDSRSAARLAADRSGAEGALFPGAGLP